MSDFITVRGAREHNLQNVSVKLPRNRFVVLTGVSGSGKSTLAFDTIYAEGQRRYVESLSAYARQFLEQMQKPDVDAIEGLSPAISIEQKTAGRNPRSTVGTITEIYDYLRLLYARIGVPHCYSCGRRIARQSVDAICDHVLRKFANQPVTVMAPVIQSKKGSYEQLFSDLLKQGFTRVRVDDVQRPLEEEIKLNKNLQHSIDVLIDKVVASGDNRSRLVEALEKAGRLASGQVRIGTGAHEEVFSQDLYCVHCGIGFEELQPRSFSFNSPFGACPDCTGLGFKQEFDAGLIIPDSSKSLLDGAINVPGFSMLGWRGQQVGAVAKFYGFNINTPWKDLAPKYRNILLFGGSDFIKFKYKAVNSDSKFEGTSRFEGVIPMLDRLYKSTKSSSRRDEMEKFLRYSKCTSCKGQRLKPASLAVTIGNQNIIETTHQSIGDLIEFFKDLELEPKDFAIAKAVLKEIRDRAFFLRDVGLAYLSLDRSANTLSGGESQRIRLATQIGSNLQGVIYVLDEPSIGLHQRDNEKLIETLHRLRDLGNTLLVVEHDEDTIRAADWVVDLGPGAGKNGGRLVAEGTPAAIEKNGLSLTGKYLSGREKIEVPRIRRKSDRFLTLKGCREHNLKNLDVSFPLGSLVCVTGVSGSGKSTLISDTLYRALAKHFFGSQEDPGAFDRLEGLERVEGVVNIDQSPIGRTPRSNPATYVGLFTPIRDLFAALPESKIRGYAPGRFSFNVSGGRCEACEGNGLIRVEMNFLPDVYVTCEECKGQRYNRETLSVKYKNHSISDVLKLSVDDARVFFEAVPSIRRKLETLQSVGLGYIELGQSATTLSGGEAQRVKLCNELSKRGEGKTMYLLDEPTTGLHFEDIKKLLRVLNALVEKGNTVIVIEHNLDVVKASDYLIDLGPEGGNAGGRLVATGTPEEVARNPKSFTGKFLKKVLEKRAVPLV